MARNTNLPKPPSPELLEKIGGWMEEFQQNLSQDYGVEDLHKIRRAMTVMDKLRAVRLGANIVAIGRDDDPQRQIRRGLALIPQAEKLLDMVERGTGKKLEEFGSYLPEDAKCTALRDLLASYGARRLAGMVNAHIPKSPTPPKADRRSALIAAPRPGM